jgi:hypothetical protein
MIAASAANDRVIFFKTNPFSGERRGEAKKPHHSLKSPACSYVRSRCPLDRKHESQRDVNGIRKIHAGSAPIAGRFFDESVTTRVSTLTALLVPLLAFAQHAPPARPFQPFDGCIYKPQRWSDGDSFHVILPDGKEVIFRLYFVDTPEEERVYADRIAEQAAHFGISPNAAAEVGREASEFTQNRRSQSRSPVVYPRVTVSM